MKHLVLMYHEISSGDPEDRFSVSAVEFGRHVGVIEELVERDQLDVTITFDDGHLSDFLLGFPELKRRSLRATSFVVPSTIGEKGHMNWQQVRELDKGGITIGSHTQTHSNLALLSEKETLRELEDSKAQIEERLGHEVHDLALPGGFLKPRTLALAKSVGYSRIYTSVPGFWNGHSDIVPRVCLRRGCSSETLKRIATGKFSTYHELERLKAMARGALGPNIYPALFRLLRGSERDA